MTAAILRPPWPSAGGALRLFLLALPLALATGCASAGPVGGYPDDAYFAAPAPAQAPQLVIVNRGMTTASVEFIRSGTVVYRKRIMPQETVVVRYPAGLQAAPSPEIVVRTMDADRPYVVSAPVMGDGAMWELTVERQLPFSTLLPARVGG